MGIHSFFSPLGDTLIASLQQLLPEHIGKHIALHHSTFPQWEEADIVLMGCGVEDSEAADEIRTQLFQLTLPFSKIKLVDIGNLRPQESAQATREIVGYVAEKLLNVGKTLIIIGDTREVAFGQMTGYAYNFEANSEPIGQVNYVCISPYLDLHTPTETVGKESVNYRILNQYPPRVQSFCNLGYQRYRVTQSELDLLKNMHFAAVRYGILQDNIQETEPYLRDAHAVCFDVSSIRHADFPAAIAGSPGGFSATEACQLARYAGTSTEVSSFSLTDYVPQRDIHQQGALLSAMILWYFIEGFYYRRPEHPETHPDMFKKYTVRINASIESIVFYQSNQSDRWWMEIHYGKGAKIIPCTERDYQSAINDEIPERWWNIFNRFS